MKTCTSRLLPTTCLYPFTGMYCTFLSAQPAWHMVIFELVVPLNPPFLFFFGPLASSGVVSIITLLYYVSIKLLYYYCIIYIILLHYLLLGLWQYARAYMQKRRLHQVCICAHKICKSDDKYAYCVAYMQKASVDMQVAGLICIIYANMRLKWKHNFALK